MTTPHYTLVITVRIKAVREHDDVLMQRRMLIPFTPIEGMSIDLWRESEEENETEGETYLIPLSNVKYSIRDCAFLVEIEDDDAVDAHRETGHSLEVTKDLIAFYASFGFLRLNYPTIHTVRKQDHDDAN